MGQRLADTGKPRGGGRLSLLRLRGPSRQLSAARPAACQAELATGESQIPRSRATEWPGPDLDLCELLAAAHAKKGIGREERKRIKSCMAG